MLVDEAIASTDLHDRISVPSTRILTDSGQMLVTCKFARTGSQKYLAHQVFRTQALLDEQGLSENDIVVLHRDEDTVFSDESMETFRSAPVTIGHPKDKDGNPISVTSANSKEYQVGVLEGMPTRDEDTLGGTLVLTAQEAIDALLSGTEELSAGYSCNIVKINDEYFQRDVRANHIAIVPKGRAGSSCRISDEALEVENKESAYSKEALATGTKHEMEHTTVESEAAKIAKDHLDEDPEYYSKLSKAGIDDDHPEPKREDFKDSDSYDNAMAIWKENEEAEPKEVSNTAMVDEALLTDAQNQIITLTDELAVQKELVATMKQAEDEAIVAVEAMKVELADAKLAASQGVVERCEVLEQARLIADMRDLGDKSLDEIRMLVVTDQYPDKNYETRKPAFIEAMFEMLVDTAKGETPMSKLLKTQTSHVIVDAKHVDPVEESRKKMIERQKAQTK